ncbi:metalloendopeptidase [Nephila pilipes]|uniref:Metalloendopeptidase n=1 Tax=Nephila pilipes TaxID=299642 RepID=A0A8X6P4H4_NEPPI|nr:metalloendopeptidase [Nephila pilipes]
MHLFIILGLIVTTWAGRPRHPMENPDMYEGDILLDDDDDRNALVGETNKWPGGVIPYEIGISLTKYSNQIEEAMNYLSNRTCIQFTERRYFDDDYIYIFPGYGQVYFLFKYRNDPFPFKCFYSMTYFRHKESVWVYTEWCI